MIKSIFKENKVTFTVVDFKRKVELLENLTGLFFYLLLVSKQLPQLHLPEPNIKLFKMSPFLFRRVPVNALIFLKKCWLEDAKKNYAIKRLWEEKACRLKHFGTPSKLSERPNQAYLMNYVFNRNGDMNSALGKFIDYLMGDMVFCCKYCVYLTYN